MNVRFALTALLATLSLPALATSGFTPGSGESGGTTHVMPESKTRAQVMQELADWRRNPVTSDGWKALGGEVGWVYVGTDRSARGPSAAADPISGAPEGASPATSSVSGSGAGLARSGHLSSAAHRSHR